LARIKKTGENMGHRITWIVHAMNRFRERYGEYLSREQYFAMVDLIQNGKSVLSKRQTTSRALHLLNIGGRKIAAVYSNKHNRIITFVPVENMMKEALLKATEPKSNGAD
jgi:hypothetical protein